MSKENMRGGNENGTAYIGSSDFRSDVCPDCHGQNRAAVCVPWLWTFDDRTGALTGHAQ